ncbi:MAG: UDP-N-acetylmuramate dehydrogenase [Acutalibacteraceae bacterium]|mgnify:CR=1 FL=1|nr:UDP-N-acetylmuramate dehydrogenase [Clostridiales bacterium]
MPDYAVLDAALTRAGIPFLRDERMSAHTSFKIGGPADRFLRIADAASLSAALAALSAAAVPYFALGNGSNLLVPDEGLRGAVLALGGEFKSAELSGSGRLLCGSAVSLAAACALARDNALTGLEFAWGIPGSLGGALYMNAGAYGGEMKQAVSRVWFVEEDGTPASLSGEGLRFGYRTSAFTNTRRVITKAELCLAHGAEAEITAKMDDLMQRRKSKQPVELPSAGSVFKRPEGHFAGTLIENCGLKGFRIGGACVSEKHAGFIVNCGRATCADVERLIAHIQETVLRETGVQLEPEVRRIRL